MATVSINVLSDVTSIIAGCCFFFVFFSHFHRMPRPVERASAHHHVYVASSREWSLTSSVGPPGIKTYNFTLSLCAHVKRR